MEKVFGKARRIIKREHDCITTIIIFINDEFAVRCPHKFGQLFVYDFYDLLRRAEAL